MLVPRMLDDALRLSIDNICDTKYSFSQFLEDNNINNNNNQPENENSLNILAFILYFYL